MALSFVYIITNTLLLLTVAPISIESRMKCGSMTNNMGYTFPAGDVLIHYGKESLDLTCTVNNEDILAKDPNPSRHLFFTYNSSKAKSTIINSTSIHYHVDADHLEIGDRSYFCYYKNKVDGLKGVCSNVVFVATPPRNVTDFKCISYNHDRLECRWSKENFGIRTTYSLNYTALNNSRKCPQTEMYNDVQNKYVCYWGLLTNPAYRQAVEEYEFRLEASNKLGKIVQKFEFDHFANVKPDAPEYITVINTTTNSISLSWPISPSMQSFKYGLQYRVIYNCTLGMNDSRVAAINAFHDKKNVSFTIRDIPYAYNLCYIRVGLRSNKSREEAMWSDNAKIDTYTSSTVPGASPKLNMGSYRVINGSAVQIYWQKVPKEYEYGPNLVYNVSLRHGDGNVVISEIRNNYAVIRNLSLASSYTFAVWAKNDAGERNERAYITIPARHQRPHLVMNLRKVESREGSFNISWSHDQYARIDNYTIFWCKDIYKSSNEYCNGNWEWEVVGSDWTQFSYVDNSPTKNAWYSVAISSNSETASSGMSFSMCDEFSESIPQIKLTHQFIADTQVKLSWEVRCSNEGINHYVIDYCLVNDLDKDNCVGGDGALQHEEVDGAALEYVVKGLNPYKTYLFYITPHMNNNNVGKRTDAIRVSTLEGPPSSPRDLSVLNITNTSITLSWKKPLVSNGVIKEYRFNCDKFKEEKTTNSSDGGNNTVYALTDLKSYETYNISVSACTIKCSEPSNFIVNTTLMGRPSKIDKPTSDSINETGSYPIKWSKPSDPRGPISYYEVQLVTNEKTTNFYNTTENKYTITCEQNTNTISLRVRALNLDHEKNNFTGEWSDDFGVACKSSISWLIPTMGIMGVLIVILLFFSKRIYKRLVEMQDVTAKLPIELQNPVWSQAITNDCDQKPIQPPDEQKLLKHDSAERGKKIYDSSGCSSAQGSVVSDSDATISEVTDSGTEQSELRKRSRNLSKTSLISNPESKVMESYSRVGIETNPLADADDVSLDYTHLGISPTLYVDRIEPPSIKPSESAYVSHMALSQALQKPKEENKPYVTIADANLMKNNPEQKLQQTHSSDAKPSYVTVGQIPTMKTKMNKLYDAMKED